ncbi:hypothetical protein HZH66_008384 [Vespula vulgaris]|uniref:Uncharacterized protein n=1 Tax=Vespula vulgaris TaxID=7454 RepID=A0A834JVZ4_VESVU|nr:hypothetical protein HZH66_008384 [Vespula vulgaris]
MGSKRAGSPDSNVLTQGFHYSFASTGAMARYGKRAAAAAAACRDSNSSAGGQKSCTCLETHFPTAYHVLVFVVRCVCLSLRGYRVLATSNRESTFRNLSL